MTTEAQETPATEAPQANAQQDAADDAAFEAGFNGTPESKADTPAEPKGDTPAQEKKDTPAAEAPATPAEDPWKDVPPVLREQFDSVNKRFDTMMHHLKSTDGRIGAVQKAITAARTDAGRAGAEAPSQQQIAAATTTEKWKKLEQDFPEWAGALNERMAADRAAISAEIKGMLPKPVDVQGTVQPLLNEVKAEARALARIDAKHDGWEETVNTREFGDWLSRQPADIQSLADSTKAGDAIKLLDAFKEASKPQPAPVKDPAKQQQQTRRLEQAVTPQGAGRSTPPALSDDDAFESGFYGGQRKSA